MSGENSEVVSPHFVGLWRSLGARFHGMEEVVGSIPTRSTKYINNLKGPPLSDFVAFLSQIPKSLRESALKLRPLSVR
jgi:hypothetical protein